MAATRLSKIRESVAAFRRSHIADDTRRRLADWHALIAQVKQRQPGNIAAEGFKVYSQNDEDGIVEAIFERLGNGRTFIEIGVQDGTECNTHYLLLKGWRGAWIEADTGHCRKIVDALGGDRFGDRFELVGDFVRPGNVGSHYRDICGFLGVEEVDFFSLDIDSNDLFVLRALLETGARPTVVCVEYNGKFPPPLSIGVTLDESRSWAGDDYFGASLQAFHDVFTVFGYRLVTCNVLGINAFFVRSDQAGAFAAISPEEAWHPLRLDIGPLPGSHTASMKFLRDRLNAAG